jgi:2-aminoethylphosphonate dioxygenase
MIDEHTTILKVSPGRHKEGILAHKSGVIAPEVDATMKYQHVIVSPGDVVLFDSYLPHRSDENTTNTWRRLAYLTYNPSSEGNHREAYYKAKAAVMKTGAISINLDFGGKIVD